MIFSQLFSNGTGSMTDVIQVFDPIVFNKEKAKQLIDSRGFDRAIESMAGEIFQKEFILKCLFESNLKDDDLAITTYE